jgi:hypothetical protein
VPATPEPGPSREAALGGAGPCRYLMLIIPCPWTRMPPAKPASSADIDTVIARSTPDLLTLLGDGVPRSRGTIIAALADRHARADIRRTLMA